MSCAILVRENADGVRNLEPNRGNLGPFGSKESLVFFFKVVYHINAISS